MLIKFGGFGFHENEKKNIASHLNGIEVFFPSLQCVSSLMPSCAKRFEMTYQPVEQEVHVHAVSLCRFYRTSQVQVDFYRSLLLLSCCCAHVHPRYVHPFISILYFICRSRCFAFLIFCLLPHVGCQLQWKEIDKRCNEKVNGMHSLDDGDGRGHEVKLTDAYLVSKIAKTMINCFLLF